MLLGIVLEFFCGQTDACILKERNSRGCLSVGILFNVVSVPLMEKRQCSRRPEYRDYQKRTGRLLLRPQKQK